MEADIDGKLEAQRRASKAQRRIKNLSPKRSTKRKRGTWPFAKK
jgi:hypothetical protein